MTLYPELDWGFITSEAHTVVVGYFNDWQRPVWVMDILLFKENTAQKSLDFVQSKETKFYASLGRYAASFFADPVLAYETTYFDCDE